MGIFGHIAFHLHKLWNSAKQEQEAALVEYDRQRDAWMLAREQMDIQREQAREGRWRRREMRREYKRRRRNFYSVSDDEVEYGTQRRPKSRALSRLHHLGLRSHHKPKFYTPGVTPAPVTPTALQRATSASPEGATHVPNLAHLPQVTRTASAEVISPVHLHPNHAYANGALVQHTGTSAAPSSRPRTASQDKAHQTHTGIPEDYGNAQFAKEERWRAREKRRLEKEEERERRDAAYDQAPYGAGAYNPYVAAAAQ